MNEESSKVSAKITGTSTTVQSGLRNLDGETIDYIRSVGQLNPASGSASHRWSIFEHARILQETIGSHRQPEARSTAEKFIEFLDEVAEDLFGTDPLRPSRLTLVSVPRASNSPQWQLRVGD